MTSPRGPDQYTDIDPGKKKGGDLSADLVKEGDVDGLVQSSNPIAFFSSQILDAGNFQLVSSAHGRINKILLTIALKIARDDDPIKRFLKIQFTQLLTALGKEREYVILCPPNEIEEIKTLIPWSDHDNIEFNFTAFKITYWSQDPYIAFQRNHPQDPNKAYQAALIYGSIFNRYDDQSIPLDLCAQSKDIITIPTNLFFQGGNLLISDEFVLMGKDYLVKNCGRPAIECADFQQVVNTFSDYFQKKVIPIGLPTPIPDDARKNKHYGGIFQPIYHIDLFISVIGVKHESGKEILLIGRLNKAKEILATNGIDLPDSHFTGDEYFARIQSELEKTNLFHLIEVPLFRPKSFRFRNMDLFYYNTYNNAQVENYKRSSGGEVIQRVILPQYSQSEGLEIDAEENQIRVVLDKAAVEIWESLGFEVIPVQSMEFWAMLGGSVHCMTKVLSRTMPVLNPE